ncbi:MAG: class I SAM-dependent methyltransferase [Alphaproteobacteria bacterium]|nr:class I SAM-dependent methyltransferase [Alphaproteobacteria bacterium]
MPQEPEPPSELRRQRESWLRRTRSEWYRVIRPHGRWVPWDLADQVQLDDSETEDYFQPASTLSARHLKNCRLVAERAELLKSCLPKHGVVAEIGTDQGNFAALILEHAAPTQFHVIDRTLNNFRRDRFEKAIAAGQMHLHEGDSASIVGRFGDATFDWIYIDADHSYEGVKRDICVAKMKIKPGGLLVFNDYIFWSHRELESYGVVQAVNEFCLAEDWELLYVALHPEMYQDVVLRKI